MAASGPPQELTLRPIGHVRTAYADPAETPIQTRRNPDERGRLVVLDQYADALDGLEEFDYAHLICFLDRVWEANGRGSRPFAGDRLRPVPFLLQDTGERVGVFATRSPVRPNYLALSLVNNVLPFVCFAWAASALASTSGKTVVFVAGNYFGGDAPQVWAYGSNYNSITAGALEDDAGSLPYSRRASLRTFSRSCGVQPSQTAGLPSACRAHFHQANLSTCSTISPSRNLNFARTSLTTGRPVCVNV